MPTNAVGIPRASAHLSGSIVIDSVQDQDVFTTVSGAALGLICPVIIMYWQIPVSSGSLRSIGGRQWVGLFVWWVFPCCVCVCVYVCLCVQYMCL